MVVKRSTIAIIVVVAVVVKLPLVFGALVLLEDAGPGALLSALACISGNEVLF